MNAFEDLAVKKLSAMLSGERMVHDSPSFQDVMKAQADGIAGAVFEFGRTRNGRFYAERVAADAVKIDRATSNKYPFRTMRVMDGFIVDSEQGRDRAMAAANSYSCTKHGRGKSFASRKVPKGYRVWRTA